MIDAPKYTYRKASGDDHTDILAVLEEVASEVPVKLDTSAHQEAIKEIIVACCDSGESWVAVDDGGTVVGFALVKPDVFERALNKNNALSLRYVGVSKNSRQRGIFATLMENLMVGKNAPLNASVLHANKSAMADRLIKIGYEKVGADDKKADYRWSPVPPAVKA
jgi:N-acetylglutamate synthase-like GNAT family acetyltransferase